jgi:hypothetical protein
MNRAVICLLLASACTTPDLTGPEDDGEDTLPEEEMPEEEVPEEETPAPAVIAGSYTLTSTFGITVDSTLPGPAYEAVTLLQDLRSDPAATLFALLDEAGVPLAQELLDALPGVLEDQLNDALNGALDGSGLGARIDWLLAQTQTVLGTFDLVSSLEVPASTGHAAGFHRPLQLVVAGTAVDLPAADLISTPVEIWAEEQDLVLGDHSFGLAYGELTFQALEQLALAETGGDLRAMLGQAVSCPAIAADVADTCVLGACIGHAAELQSLCELGLDEAVNQLHEELAAMRFDAVHLASGRAAVDGASLSGGSWTAEINLGQGLRGVPATFHGARR